ncbi:MAG: type II secretion system F family protein [Magnetococcales bacterium]|nr:type II secretion system F family protein [Magnetococcales bacterium]MBF0156700.1 type II secretion system F family protein [Magnetococcales bacterium]
MPKYAFKATDDQGNIRNGVLEAANVDDLELRLDKLGLFLIQQKISGRKGQGAGAGMKSVKRQDLILFCYHMEQIAQSGIPLLEGLTGLRDGLTHAGFRQVVANMVEDIEGGRTLSGSMANYSGIFDPVFVQLIKVGERTGQLDVIFRDMTAQLKWEDELVSHTKKVMMYPAIVGSVVTGVIFFLMIYLVPQLMAFIADMGGEPPMHTKALIATSGFISEWWYLILAAPVLFTILVKFGRRTSPRFHLATDRIKLRLWIFGPLLRKIILVRFARSFALLYKSGITVLEGIEISEGLVGNLVIDNALKQVRRLVSDGREISASFKEVGLFPPLVLRMLEVGEATGNLDSSLLNVSYFFDREIKESISRLETLIEPAMTGVLGLLLGWVILSVLGPIYDIISRI